jgi:hypothetical protein
MAIAVGKPMPKFSAHSKNYCNRPYRRTRQEASCCWAKPSTDPERSIPCGKVTAAIAKILRTVIVPWGCPLHSRKPALGCNRPRPRIGVRRPCHHFVLLRGREPGIQTAQCVFVPRARFGKPFPGSAQITSGRLTVGGGRPPTRPPSPEGWPSGSFCLPEPSAGNFRRFFANLAIHL